MILRLQSAKLLRKAQFMPDQASRGGLSEAAAGSFENTPLGEEGQDGRRRFVSGPDEYVSVCVASQALPLSYIVPSCCLSARFIEVDRSLLRPCEIACGEEGG